MARGKGRGNNGTQGFLQDFAAQSSTATVETPEWLDALRRTAMERFAATGFPTTRDEEWRFTPVAPIARTSWPQASGGEVFQGLLEPFIFGHPEWTTLVFINGIFSEGLTSIGPLAPGLRVGNLADAISAGSSGIETYLGR